METDFNSLQLEKELRQLGMPTFMNEETKTKLLGKDPLTLNFEMKYDQMGVKKIMMVELYLHKYDQLGFHVPAGYKATLKDEPVKSRVFPSSSQLHIRAKEAFNLLQGRPVSKAIWNPSTNRFRNSWIRLDFNQQDSQNHYAMRELHLSKDAFPIGQLLRNYPIQVDRPEELFDIMHSLYAGNIHRIDAKDRDPQKATYIEALPEKRELQLYDNKGQVIDISTERMEVARRNAYRNRWKELSPGRTRGR